MSVLVDKSTRVLVQGLGKTGQFHTDTAIAYGTQMVAGVHPSRAGSEFHFEGERARVIDQAAFQALSLLLEAVARTPAER